MRFAWLALVLCVACAPLNGPSASVAAETTAQQDEASIRAVLAKQQSAWNSGDIDAFMEGYWKSPELRFTSGNTVTYGWDETLARYKKHYQTKDIMGQLTFDIMQIEQPAPDLAIVLGRFTLKREVDEPTGLFTLIFRKFEGQWLIVSDHTSS